MQFAAEHRRRLGDIVDDCGLEVADDAAPFFDWLGEYATQARARNFTNALFTPAKSKDSVPRPQTFHAEKTPRANLLNTVPPSPATVRPLMRFAPKIPSQLGKSEQVASGPVDTAVLRDIDSIGIANAHSTVPMPVDPPPTTLRQLRLPKPAIPKMPNEDDDEDAVPLHISLPLPLPSRQKYNEQILPQKRPIPTSTSAAHPQLSLSLVPSAPIRLTATSESPQKRARTSERDSSSQSLQPLDEELVLTKSRTTTTATTTTTLLNQRPTTTAVSDTSLILAPVSLSSSYPPAASLANAQPVATQQQAHDVKIIPEREEAKAEITSHGIIAKPQVAVHPLPREEKPEIKSLKGKLAGLKKKLDGRGGKKKDNNADGGAGSSMPGKTSLGESDSGVESGKSSYGSDAPKSGLRDSVLSDVLVTLQPIDNTASTVVSQDTQLSNASFTNLSQKPNSTINKLNLKNQSNPPTSLIAPAQSFPIQPKALAPTKNHDTFVDSDGDVDMSIEDCNITPESEQPDEEDAIAFDSVDPTAESKYARVLVANTQKPDAWVESDGEDLDKSENDDEMMECGQTENFSDDSCRIKKKPTISGKAPQPIISQKSPPSRPVLQQQDQGWIGKIVSGISSFLPSPSKATINLLAPSTPVVAPQSSHIPKLISKPTDTLNVNTQHGLPPPAQQSRPPAIAPAVEQTVVTVPAASTSRLALKKGGKEIAKKRVAEEEKRAQAARAQEDAIRLRIAEKKEKEDILQKELINAALRIPPPVAADVTSINLKPPENPAQRQDASDDDMEFCSQPVQPAQGGGKPKSKILGPTSTKLPVEAVNYSTNIVTEFVVPMTATQSLSDVSAAATPKAYPRHNPSSKATAQLQSILKPATPSFDAKLAERIKDGLVVDPPIPVPVKGKATLPASKTSLLAGLHGKIKGVGSDGSTNGTTLKGKKDSNGPATIVDENGELPDIADSDDEDQSSEEDNSREPTPAKPEPKKAVVPAWVETPNLMKTLTQQVIRDPDEIFGTVKPLVLEDVFKGGKVHRKFRDSMAGNWVGNGALTREEEEEYKREMGFK